MPIIWLTDFSECAQQAGRLAEALALRTAQPVLVLHGLEELGARSAFASGETALYEPLAERLASEAERLRARGLSVEWRLEPEAPPHALRAALPNLDGSLVVLGSRGRQAQLARRLLGTLLERLADSVDVPLLVVERPEPLLAESGIRSLALDPRARGSAERWLGAERLRWQGPDHPEHPDLVAGVARDVMARHDASQGWGTNLWLVP